MGEKKSVLYKTINLVQHVGASRGALLDLAWEGGSPFGSLSKTFFFFFF